MNNQMKTILIAVGLLVVGGGLFFIASSGGVELSVTDPFKGPEDAPIVIEEFSDFQCPACRAAAPIVAELLNQYPEEVRLTYRDFPLPSHDEARPAAIAALCAAQQGKFSEFHDRLFRDQTEWASPDVSVEPLIDSLTAEYELDADAMNTCRSSRQARSEVERDFSEGQERGVDSTPTFFVDGRKIQNPGSLFAWRELIDNMLEEKGIMTKDEAAGDEAMEGEAMEEDADGGAME